MIENNAVKRLSGSHRKITRVRINFDVSSRQRRLMDKARGDDYTAVYLRRLLAADVERMGYRWEDDDNA